MYSVCSVSIRIYMKGAVLLLVLMGAIYHVESLCLLHGKILSFRSKVLKEVRPSQTSLRLAGSNQIEGPIFSDILEQQYLDLTSSTGNKLLWEKFFAWEEVQAVLSEEVCDAADIEEIWTDIAGSKESSMDYSQFVEISDKLDSFFEVMDDVGVVESIEYASAAPSGTPSGANDDIITDIDVWSQDLNPGSAMEPEFLAYLSAFFKQSTEGKGTGRLSYDAFAGWGDVQSMLEEGEVDESCLKDLWAEACVQQSAMAMGSGEQQQAAAAAANDQALGTTLNKGLGLDAFLRLNLRLDQTLDEIAEALDTLTDDDVTDYYRGIFKRLTAAGGATDGNGNGNGDNSDGSKMASGGSGSGGGMYMSRDTLMQWARGELDGVVSAAQLEALWEALPKHSSGSGRGEMIDLASFLAFNTAVEDIEESELM